MTEFQNMLLVKKLSPHATLPFKAHPGDAGYDIASAINIVIPPFEKALCLTNLAITVPEGTYGRLAPRSGLALKHIDVGGGVLDRGYTNDVGVILFNHSAVEFKVSVGDRIAQLILEKIVTDAKVQEVQELAPTKRGTNGFGSTGVAAPIIPKQKMESEEEEEEENWPCPRAVTDSSAYFASS